MRLAEKEEQIRRWFPDYPGEIVCLDEVDSTNDYAAALCRNGIECAVTADVQTAGRGRLGRAFASPMGGLYISVAVRTEKEPEELLPYPLIAALAVAGAVDDVCGTRVDIKWPNDLQIRGKKICGILTQLAHASDCLMLVVGVGINVRNQLPAELTQAGILEELTGKEVDISLLASRVIFHLQDLYRKCRTQKRQMLEEIASRCITIGRRVEAAESHESGIAFGIDPMGGLLIRDAGGRVRSIRYGDVTIMTDAVL